MLPDDGSNSLNAAEIGYDGPGRFFHVSHGAQICENRQTSSSHIRDIRDILFRDFRKNARMKDIRQEQRDWLAAQLKRQGYGTNSRLAQFIGITPNAITRMLNNDPAKETRLIKADELVKMGQFFGATPPGLDAGGGEVAPSTRPMREVPVIGKVEAGTFREVDDIGQDEVATLSMPADDRFPDARLIAFDVSGNSMNALKPRPILPGDRIVGVSYEDVADRAPIRDGMVVVVERTRDGGHTREWSVKQVELYQDRIEFHPRSTNPAHKAIVVPRDVDADSGEQVEIIALVRRIVNDVPLS